MPSNQILPGNPDFLLLFGQAVLDSLEQVLLECEQDVPDRRILAFQEPPEDCCPDLAVWVDNMRPWDGTPFEGLTFGHLTACNNMWAADVNVRIGRCYIDVDPQTSQPLPPDQVKELSAQIYRDGNILYTGWVNKMRNNEVCNITRYSLNTVSALLSYNDGGCAGWRFTVTVGFS